MYLLFNFDIVNLALKTIGGQTEDLVFYYCSLECFNCRWVVGGGMGKKVLFIVA